MLLIIINVSVSNLNMQFLKQNEEEPLLQIQNLNPRLYEHVSEIADIQVTYFDTCDAFISYHILQP